MKGFAEHFVDDGSNYELNDPALLIVDMVNDFCKEGGAMVLPEGMETVEPTQRLIAAFREKKLPIIFINDWHRAGKYAEDYQIPKRRFSGFYQTDLDLVLRELGRKTVVVTGVVTNICVRSTCHDAFFRGYQVVVPRDCVRATGPREQESSLWDIETHFGAVTDSDAVLARL